MSEIRETFAKLSRNSECGLIGYVTAGDPDLSSTPGIVGALVEGGADIIELGIPFSDPIADGPTIQAATLRALKAGTTPRRVFKTVEEIKAHSNIPIVLLTYYNIIFKLGEKIFFESAEACGVSGIIVPDLPLEESHDYKTVADSFGVDTIFLATPTTSNERLGRIIEHTSGFLYLVSVFGVTGVRRELQETALDLIERTVPIVRERVPLAMGFGISSPWQVKKLTEFGVDAVIVGSAFVKLIERYTRKEEMLGVLQDYCREMKLATK